MLPVKVSFSSLNPPATYNPKISLDELPPHKNLFNTVGLIQNGSKPHITPNECLEMINANKNKPNNANDADDNDLSSCIQAVDMEKGIFWYFAIGSMINPVSSLLRGLKPVESYPAIAHDYKMIFDGAGGMASIVSSPGSSFHGVLHRLNGFEMAELDRIEFTYERIAIDIMTYDKKIQKAFVYKFDEAKMDRSIPTNPPGERYLDIIIRGCHYYGVDESYINYLSSCICIPRKSLDSLNLFTLDESNNKVIPIHSLTEGTYSDKSNEASLLFSVNCKVIEVYPPSSDKSSNIMFEWTKKNFQGRDVTLSTARNLYEPRFPIAKSILTMSEEHKKFVEDLLCTRFINTKASFKVIGTVDIQEVHKLNEKWLAEQEIRVNIQNDKKSSPSPSTTVSPSPSPSTGLNSNTPSASPNPIISNPSPSPTTTTLKLSAGSSFDDIYCLHPHSKQGTSSLCDTFPQSHVNQTNSIGSSCSTDTEKGTIWYFAIGSMINPVSLLLRNIHPIESYPATLKGYKLLFAGRLGMATVIPSAEDQFDGVVHLLSISEMKILDEIERGYNRVEVTLSLYDGKTQPAFVYMMKQEFNVELSPPSERYLDIIVRGCIYYGVRPSHIDWLCNIPCIPRKSSKEFKTFDRSCCDNLPQITFDTLAQNNGNDNKPIQFSINGLVLEMMPTDDPTAKPYVEYTKIHYAGKDITVKHARNLYEPRFPIAKSCSCMPLEQRLWVEDFFLSIYGAHQVKVVGKIDLQDADKGMGNDKN